MRCADCGLYECVLRSPMGGCPNGQKAQTEETVTLGIGPYEKGYQPADVMRKEATLCKWYWAGECKKGLPGTKCELTKCVAWEENKASIYDFGLAGIGVMRDAYSVLADVAKSLVEAVEGYVCPKKGDKYVFRNEVLAKCNELKKLLNEKE